ncbi:MAG: hypothetical protein ABJF23_03230 [Bryobacteraceae bacterium]
MRSKTNTTCRTYCTRCRPWISDIRAEEFTPSYAGSSTRMDFLLPAHGLVIETKIIRDRPHAKHVGNELIIDIDHYRNILTAGDYGASFTIRVISSQMLMD